MAMVSALLAFGRVDIILRKLTELRGLLGESPSSTVASLGREGLRARLLGFRHRTFRGEDIADLLYAATVVQRRDGTVFAPLSVAWEREKSLRPTLAAWVSSLRAIAWPEGPTRSAKHLLPDPMGPSASKRLLLLLRWAARPDDGVDLGLTSAIPPSGLVVPLDVHVHRLGRCLGFTRRTDGSWATAEEVTASLRTLCPEDPVRYDFALSHLGMNVVKCPARRDPTACGLCPLRSGCVHWG